VHAVGRLQGPFCVLNSVCVSLGAGAGGGVGGGGHLMWTLVFLWVGCGMGWVGGEGDRGDDHRGRTTTDGGCSIELSMMLDNTCGSSSHAQHTAPLLGTPPHPQPPM